MKGFFDFAAGLALLALLAIPPHPAAQAQQQLQRSCFFYAVSKAPGVPNGRHQCSVTIWRNAPEGLVYDVRWADGTRASYVLMPSGHAVIRMEGSADIPATWSKGKALVKILAEGFTTGLPID